MLRPLETCALGSPPAGVAVGASFATLFSVNVRVSGCIRIGKIVPVSASYPVLRKIPALMVFVSSLRIIFGSIFLLYHSFRSESYAGI